MRRSRRPLGGLLDLLDRRHDLRQAARGALRHALDPAHLGLAGGHGRGDLLHLLADDARRAGHVLGRSGRLVRQLSHLFGDHREPAAVLAGARRLDRRVQGEQVRLRGDAFDQVHEVVDGGALLGELCDLGGCGLHHLTHVEQRAPGRGDVATMPVGHRADLLPEARHPRRGLAHLRARAPAI